MDCSSCSKHAKLETCSICNIPGDLVNKPKFESYKKLCATIAIRKKFKEEKYQGLYARIDNKTPKELEKLCITWDRECYSDFVGSSKVKRAEIRYHKAILGEQPKPGHPSKEDEESLQHGMFRRSSTFPYDKCMCFFCQEVTDEEPMHKEKSRNTQTYRELLLIELTQMP